MTSEDILQEAAPCRVSEEVSDPNPGKVTRHLISGTSGLGASVFIERGAGFLANILAARLGGASTFGTYSLAISTANNIATYAGAGIGSTAVRFSGKYPFGTPGYRMLARVLTLVSLISAAGAALALWLCARPLARLMGQIHLVDVLRWAALSAGATILLECARGFFVGQRRLAALLFMSLLVGGGLLFMLPLAAHQHDAKRMIFSQGCVTLGAVALCMLLARKLGLIAQADASGAERFPALLREVWVFGFMQLAGLVGTNIAGWWLLTLVARADTTLAQVGFFSIASQLRNIVGMAPGLLTEGSLAVMADPEGEALRTPQQVLGYVTFASLMVAFAMSSLAILLLPWLLRAFYSNAYAHAAPAAAIGLALAVMHMGNAPASARLSVLSVRASGTINALWAVFVAVAGTCLLSRGVSATAAMAVFLGAHTLSSALVLFMLARKDSLPTGMASCFAFTTAASVMLACIAALRDAHPLYAFRFTGGIVVGIVVSLACLIHLGRRSRWIPTRTACVRVMNYVGVSAQRLHRRCSHAV